MNLTDNHRCYVCGPLNPAGLRTVFSIDAAQRTIAADFTPAPEHQGFEGIVHGGILSALLDEAMAKLAFSLGIPAVTAEMTVTFKAPAAPGQELHVSGRIIEESRRLVLAEARIARGAVVIAQASGKLIKTTHRKG